MGASSRASSASSGIYPGRRRVAGWFLLPCHIASSARGMNAISGSAGWRIVNAAGIANLLILSLIYYPQGSRMDRGIRVQRTPNRANPAWSSCTTTVAFPPSMMAQCPRARLAAAPALGSARFYPSDSGAASWGSYFSRSRAAARLQICRGLFDVPYTIAYRTDSASIHLAKSWQQSRWLSHLDLTLGNRSLKGNPAERPRPPCADRGLSSGSTVPRKQMPLPSGSLRYHCFTP